MAKLSRRKRQELRAKVPQTATQSNTATEFDGSGNPSELSQTSPKGQTQTNQKSDFRMDYGYVYTEIRSMLLTTVVMGVIMVVLSYIAVF